MSHRIEWAMWANENAVISSGILLAGGILAVSSKTLAREDWHAFWQIGAYAIVLATFIFLIEYPRGKRIRGNTLQRPFQHVLMKAVNAFSIFGRNYFVRFAFYLLACIPCLINLGSIIGGISLLVTACIYLKAAVVGEEWIPCEKDIERDNSLTRVRPPSMAPPRLNPLAWKYKTTISDEEHGSYENFPSAARIGQLAVMNQS